MDVPKGLKELFDELFSQSIDFGISCSKFISDDLIKAGKLSIIEVCHLLTIFIGGVVVVVGLSSSGGREGGLLFSNQIIEMLLA